MRRSQWWLIGLGVLALSACAAQTETVERPPTGAVAEALEPAQDERGAWTYLAPDADLKEYTRFIVEPPRVYRGEGASYPSNLSEQDREEIAQYFVDEARQALEPDYPVVAQPGPDVARLRFTLSVTYAIEAFDSESGEVVAAAVRRLTPGAFDLSSTLGTKETAHAVARDAAAKMRARLDALHAS
jgi:hypothetical protein